MVSKKLKSIKFSPEFSPNELEYEVEKCLIFLKNLILNILSLYLLIADQKLALISLHSSSIIYGEMTTSPIFIFSFLNFFINAVHR